MNGAALVKARDMLRENRDGDKAAGDSRGLFSRLTAPGPGTPEERVGPLQPAFLGVLPGRACNMACAYCNFGSKNSRGGRMSLDMAAAAVDWMAAYVHGLGRKQLDIHFFGGEPFIEEGLVEVVVHRGRMVSETLGLTPRFEVSTNGVFDGGVARFAGDYFDAVVLSLDGFREMHDRHRPMKDGGGSFEAAARTAKRLSRSPAELCIRCCVSRENVDRLEDVAAWFCDALRPSIIDFETLSVNPASEAAGLKPPDPYVFARRLVRARRVAERRGVQAVYAAAAADGPRNTFCPVGRDALIVSPNGRVNACYLPGEARRARGLDLSVGALSAEGDMIIDPGAVQRLRKLVREKPRCKRCYCRWTCAGGCHVNHSPPG
ncbi:MAG: radical SAM protein, partial [Desulfobacterales bacterium]|nr:radical SAM protein [Desulfobacterales bacterium]